MTREIKFRAISETTNGFVYGGLFNADTGMTIIENGGSDMTDFNFVKPETVGEYTGLKDKNGVEIYEGDIVRWDVNDISRTGVVYFDELQACFWIGKDLVSGHLVLNDWMRGEHTVLGNIHQNPELL